MTFEEFAALKPGDRIDNHGSAGRITEAAPRGVHVAWGGNSIVTFFYSVNSRAWVHWTQNDAQS